jgi:hypothetical protein
LLADFFWVLVHVKKLMMARARSGTSQPYGTISAPRARPGRFVTEQSLGAMMLETDDDHTTSGIPRQPTTKHRLSKSKIFGGVAVLGGLGLTAYAFAKKFKQFMTWDEENKRASEDSAALLQGKLGLAKALCDVDELNYDDIHDALKVASKEARKLARLNGQLQQRLAAMGTIPDKLS